MEFENSKLNLGSGQRPFQKPWINVDILDQGYPVDIITDINDLRMFEDNSVQIIVLHHVLEHIAIHDQSSYLKEWYRVLKPGGRLSIFVPDLKALAKAWLQGKISTYIFDVNVYGAYQGHETDLHKWGYDQQELIDRVMQFNSETKEAGIPWKEVYKPNYADKMYEGADIARDFWILDLEFCK